MINDLPTPPAAIAPGPSVDRAIPGPDSPGKDSNTLPPRRLDFEDAPEPMNRRGRRHLERDIRRSERSIFREAQRREVARRSL